MSTFKDSFVRSFYKMGRFLKDHSPEIAMVAGTIFTALGWRESQKAAVKSYQLKQDYDQKLEDLEKVREYIKDGHVDDEECSIEDIQAEEKRLKREYNIGRAKAYSGSVLLMIGGAACNWSGFLIVSRRYRHMAASYFTKAQEMMQLEKAVAATYGQDALDKLKNGEQSDGQKEIDENGNLIDKPVEHVPVEGYSFFFDESCGDVYEKDSEANRIWLSNIQRHLTDKLIIEGILTYNDILECFNKPKVQDGYEVGYVYIKDPILAARLGVHNSVDLGIFDRTINGATYRFKPGMNVDRAILIRPNLDPIPILKYSGWAKTGKVPVLPAN